MLFSFMMPGPIELAVVGIIAVLLFGSRLPKIAHSVGSSFTQFKKGLQETTNLIEDES